MVECITWYYKPVMVETNVALDQNLRRRTGELTREKRPIYTGMSSRRVRTYLAAPSALSAIT